jgi:BirA family transcriptional regulator, biotin operon repressor / biotin---[acetyl-CoA-carboxylase] ligase
MGPLLETDRIGILLAESGFHPALHAFGTIESTNRAAKDLARAGAPDGTLVTAERQTAGRGRWGRTWSSAPGKGLAFSVVLRPEAHPPRSALLTMLGATSVGLALDRIFGLKPRLRWPNDLDLDGRKICGVLTEAGRGVDGRGFSILGVGINVNETPDDFPPALRDRAGSIAMSLGRVVDRSSLLAAAAAQILRDCERAENEGFEFVLNRWVLKNAVLGRFIRLRTGEGDMTGTVRGFHSDGRLVLVGEDGVLRRFSDGEVIEVRHASGD